MNKTELRILWSNYDGGRFELVSIDNETEIRNEGIRKWFVLTRKQDDDSGYNYRQRWIAPLDDMLRAFGMQNYSELADYLEGKYLESKNALGEIKAETDSKGVKLKYTS